MTFSFIITYHNEPKAYLEECLESIFTLDLTDEERQVILVDDGSEAAPTFVLEKYGNRIDLVTRSGEGLSAARNAGLEIAGGEYIQFVDADDALMTEGYNHCLNFLRNHPRTDLVQFRYSVSKDPTVKEDYDGPYSGATFLRKRNLRPAAWGYFFRRDILSGLQFTKGILHEDEEFTPLLFLNASTLYHTKGTGYYYRQHPDSITSKKDTDWTNRRLDDFLEVIERLRTAAASMAGDKRKALMRRVHQQSMAYLYHCLELCDDMNTAEKRLAEARKHGVYPLPIRLYTTRYLLFSIVSRSSVGRWFIRMVIHRKEKKGAHA